MIYFKTNFNIIRILLFLLGVWPYHQTIFTRFQQILLFSILSSFIVLEFVKLPALCTASRLIEFFCMLLFFIFYAVQNQSLWSNIQTVKILLEQLQYVCNELRDENEITIMRKYGSKAKFYIIILALIGIIFLFAFLCFPIWPYIFQFFLPANESQPHVSLYIVTYYLMGQEKYQYLILLHMDMAVFIGTFSTLALAAIQIVHIEHACGMFKIATYRMERAITIYTLQRTVLENKILIYKKIFYAIDIHRKAIKSCDFLMSTFEKQYFCLLMISVICLSASFLRIISSRNGVSGLIAPIGVATIVFAYIFLANYIGQDVTDHNNDVYLAVYNSSWYKMPVPVQKMVLFVLQRGCKEYRLTVGGMFAASMQLCASLISTAVSYFTVMYSTTTMTQEQ